MNDFRKLIAILLMISALLLLLGCTPEKVQTEPGITLPEVTGSGQSLPTGQIGTVPAPDGQIGTVPAPDGQIGTVPAPDGQTASDETLPETEEPDVEVESNTDSTYNFVVSEGYGVGGN